MDPATLRLMAPNGPWHGGPALCATVSPVSYTMPAVNLRPAMNVSSESTEPVNETGQKQPPSPGYPRGASCCSPATRRRRLPRCAGATVHPRI